VSGEHRSLEIGGHEAVYSQIALDDPSVVAQALIADPVVQAADEIVLVLPFSADRTDQLRVLESFARDVVPHLLAAIVSRPLRSGPAEPAGEVGLDLVQRHPLLRHRVALADGDGLVLGGLEVVCYAALGADLVLAAVAAPYRLGG